MGTHGMASTDDTCGAHDMGGAPAGGIDRTEHEPTFFDQRVDAIYVLLSGRKGVLRTDELRRTIESFGVSDYLGLSYYERWLKAIALLLVEKGIASPDQLTIPAATGETRRGS